MADDGGETTPYEWFLYFCRRLVQWAAFWVGGVGTLLIFWFHWGNAYEEYGVKWYDETTKGKCGVQTNSCGDGSGVSTHAVCMTYAAAFTNNRNPTQISGKTPPVEYDTKTPQTQNSATKTPGGYCNKDQTTWCRVACTDADCRASSPAKENGGWNCGPLSDNNQDWRKIFTFKPNDFLDMFTPIALGAVEFLQHLSPDYQKDMISGTWVVRAIWLFALSLFGQFGYAGDLGVLCGYIVDFAVVLPCVALAILDHQSDEEGRSVTTADVIPTLKWTLELCGLDALCPGLTSVKGREVATKDAAPSEEQASA